MATRTAPETTVDEVLAELGALEDPKIRAVNERHGDDHGVNLTQLRAVAKRVGMQPDLARELWATGDAAARLVAILTSRPRSYSAPELDEMLREARVPKVHDWLLNYLVQKGPHADELRAAWFADADPIVASAGWSLTAKHVAAAPDDIDADGLLDIIEREMKDAPARLQWSMNEVLAAIGIHRSDLRARAIAIGERLEVLKDYPTAPNCTSPYAPLWIAEIVRRREGSS
ncbi:DNA alkylation repair protein [Agromyces atrinae]|uniref:DNA alkylation repair protein n=1 Tax=Agromyces atrinae TaxID=592376 RepID=UPI001F595512|nr:DNA alkylation repair protein [Agromyces atrinae]MCI2958457.1 DNA alkylation repair protein [Agromyces atrinae]